MGTGATFLIDVSDPYQMSMVGTYWSPSIVQDVYASGSYLYVADQDSGLQIVDVSDPSGPMLVGQFVNNPSNTGVFAVDSYAFLLNTYSGVEIINITDINSPVMVSNYNSIEDPSKIIVSGNYAYVANISSTLIILDISDPTNPIRASTLNLPCYQIADIYLSDNYLFVLEYEDGCQVFDVSNPYEPDTVTRLSYPGHARRISIKGDYIYMANEYSLAIYHIQSSNINSFDYLPSSLSLTPNYPNPFNSSTTIRYNLPTESPVTIDIYDILGRKVQTLLDVKEQVGSHQVNWSAADMPSGAYFARLKAGEQSQTMKMILMK
jgi:hypothetical protein